MSALPRRRGLAAMAVPGWLERLKTASKTALVQDGNLGGGGWPLPFPGDVFRGDPPASGWGKAALPGTARHRDRAPAKDTRPSTRGRGPRRRDRAVHPGIGVFLLTLTAFFACREAEDPLPVRGWEGDGRGVRREDRSVSE